MKNFLSKDNVSIFIIFLCFFNAISVHELITTSYTAWYFKCFAIAYSILSAFFILTFAISGNVYNIKLHKSDIVRYNYHSNIDYIKARTAFLEDEIILKSVSKYAEQLELKVNTDKNFDNFETLYNHFNTLDIEQKWFLLDQLPYKYHEKLLKKLIREQ